MKLDASQEEIIKRLSEFKILALNYAYNTITHENSKHLEPREVKHLVDIALSLEDSLKGETSEGKQARTIQRLLDRYTPTEEAGVVINKTSQLVIHAD